MKTISALILSAALMHVAFSAHAGPSPAKPYFGVTFSASLSTEVVSGTVALIHTIHVNNKTITDAVFNSGTSGVLKAGDLSLVIDKYVNLLVVNTTSTNDVIVSEIATTGTTEFGCGVEATSKSGLSLIEAASDFEFTLPSAITPSGTQVTNLRLTGKLDPATQDISRVDLSFSGGQGTISAGSTIFQGTLRQTTKVYP
jgi:hypothetical protein